MPRLTTLPACVFLLVLASVPALPATTIERAFSDKGGHVHVVLSTGQQIDVAPQQDQVSVEAPVISPDHLTTGWLFNVPNCCTSYPIPLALVIFRGGQVRHRLGDGMMIYRWAFAEGGRRVVISSGTVHGMHGMILTLYDVVTGRQLKRWRGEDGESPPKWGAAVAR